MHATAQNSKSESPRSKTSDANSNLPSNLSKNGLILPQKDATRMHKTAGKKSFPDSSSTGQTTTELEEAGLADEVNQNLLISEQKVAINDENSPEKAVDARVRRLSSKNAEFPSREFEPPLSPTASKLASADFIARQNVLDPVLARLEARLNRCRELLEDKNGGPSSKGAASSPGSKEQSERRQQIQEGESTGRTLSSGSEQPLQISNCEPGVTPELSERNESSVLSLAQNAKKTTSSSSELSLSSEQHSRAEFSAFSRDLLEQTVATCSHTCRIDHGVERRLTLNEENEAKNRTELGVDVQNLEETEIVPYKDETQMPEIMELITKDLSEPYSIYTYRYFIHNWPDLCFLAQKKSGGSFVGAIVCKLDLNRHNLRRGYIAMLAVDKECRRQRIGSRLVRCAIETMKQKGCDEVVLETEVTNEAALRLYENLGFVRDKRLFRYYLNGVDAFRLKLWTTYNIGGHFDL